MVNDEMTPKSGLTGPVWFAMVRGGEVTERPKVPDSK